MHARAFISLALILFFGCWLDAQQPLPQPPIWPGQMPAEGGGIPWPAGLGRRETITGHIGAIDKDQIMVKSYDVGEVLFWVDEHTKVHVEKYPLALSDLRVGDPVAVKLKKIKGRGPYAMEILPHPDVKERKEHPELAPKPATEPVDTHEAIVTADSAGAAIDTAVARQPSAPEFPALPAGSNGVVGTVTSVSGNNVEVRDRNNQSQKVMVTAVTLLKGDGTDTILPRVKEGDRVAVEGDRLDTGEWIAREVLVSRSAEPAEPPPATTAAAAAQEEAGPDHLAHFSGTVTAVSDGEIQVRTPRGDRRVIVTGITDVLRMGIRGTLASIRKGDQVTVAGDILEGGVISAREVTVTKLAGS